MEKSLMELLMEIPKEATTATVFGIKMQMIDNDTRLKMLQRKSGHMYSECILSNGLFLAGFKEGQLFSIYKVKGSPTNGMFQNFLKESV